MFFLVGPQTSGDEFVLTFLPDPPENRDMELIISTGEYVDVEVNVTTPEGITPVVDESVSWKIMQGC